MLTQIEFRNFKSYKTATLQLGRLTVLIGANASGKSNAIEALRLPAGIAQGERLSISGGYSKKAVFKYANQSKKLYTNNFKKIVFVILQSMCCT